MTVNHPSGVGPSAGTDPTDPFVAARAAALDELARPAGRRRGRRTPLFERAAGSPVVGARRRRDRGPASSRPGPWRGPVPADQAEREGPAPDRFVAASDTRAGARLPAVGRSLLPDAPAGPRRVLTLAAAGVVALVVVAAVVLLRRPPPAEDTLPRAITEPASATGATSTTAGTVTVPAGGADGPDAGSATVAAGPAGSDVTVHVAGAVSRPGVVTLAPGSRVVDAVAAAGGMVAGADPDRVNLAAPLVDGRRVVVPLVGQAPPAEVVPSGGAAEASGAGGAAVPAVGAPVDLNTADEAALDSLPGIGPATAAAIVAHRGEAGPFRSVDDLLDVRGIGEAKLEALRGLVTAGS